MSYNVTLWCGCSVYVSCNPKTRLAHTRIIEARGAACPVRNHDVGARLWLWELLPAPSQGVPAPAAVHAPRGSAAAAYAAAPFTDQYASAHVERGHAQHHHVRPRRH